MATVRSPSMELGAKPQFEQMHPWSSPRLSRGKSADSRCILHDRECRFLRSFFDGFDGGRCGEGNGRRLAKGNLVWAAQ